MDDRTTRRQVFDAIAEEYDRHRPRYPDALFDDLLALPGLPARCRVLEIGPGPGTFTRPLAERGHQVVAVELGANLADVLRRNVAGLDVEVVVADFENWTIPTGSFDLVVSATAFHWLDPDRRWHLAAAALRPGGWLAVGTTLHVAGSPDDPWFEGPMTDCYVRHTGQAPGFRLPPVDDLHGGFDDSARATGLFDEPVRFAHLWDWDQTTEEFVATLATHSSQLVLPAEQRRALLDCIGARLDEHGGAVRLRVASVFGAGRRR